MITVVHLFVLDSGMALPEFDGTGKLMMLNLYLFCQVVWLPVLSAPVWSVHFASHFAITRGVPIQGA